MSRTHELKAKIVEKPMLFSGPMVRAILNGRKTQTRRIVKNKIALDWLENATFTPKYVCDPGNYLVPHPIGNRAWVRETVQFTRFPGKPIVGIRYTADECDTSRRLLKMHPGWVCRFPDDIAVDPQWREGFLCKRTPSIYMPRWASRITLEITDVRVQRLRDISEEDALAEGVDKLDFYTLLNRICHNGGLPRGIKIDPPYVRDFSKMWNRINGDGAWDQNPWVFAYTFKKLEASHE